MVDGDNRRKSERRHFEEEIYTYVEGNRLDADSQDVSAGGAFLRTWQTIPVDAKIAVVFKKQAQTTSPVFVVGKVVRSQTDPAPGVALVWEKALTMGAPSELEWFLSAMFGLVAPVVKMEKEPGKWEMLAVYRFGASDDDKQGADDQAKSTFDASSHQTVRQFPLEALAADYPSADEDGSLTVRIAKSGLRAPAGIDGELVMGDDTQTVRITHLGASSMFVQTGMAPPDSHAVAVVRFSIRTTSEEVPIICQCRVTASDAGADTGIPGVDLEFIRVDEGPEAGILKKFVRWLHFEALTED